MVWYGMVYGISVWRPFWPFWFDPHRVPIGKPLLSSSAENDENDIGKECTCAVWVEAGGAACMDRPPH